MFEKDQAVMEEEEIDVEMIVNVKNMVFEGRGGYIYFQILIIFLIKLKFLQKCSSNDRNLDVMIQINNEKVLYKIY